MTATLEAPTFTCQGLTMDEIRSRVEVETDVSLWGQPHKITPRLCSEVFGDGQKPIAFGAIFTRPMYYVVLVDSLMFSCHCENYDNPNCTELTCMHEASDCIMNAIEGEHPHPWESEDSDEDEDEERESEFDGGCWWNPEYKIPAVKVLTG